MEQCGIALIAGISLMRVLFGELKVFFVFRAEVFQQVFTILESSFLRIGDGSRIGPGVVDRYFDFQVTCSAAAKPLGQAHVL